MLKQTVFYLKNMVLFFFIFHVNTSYSYVISIVKQGSDISSSGSYLISGHLNKSDLTRVPSETNYWQGVSIFYDTPEWNSAAVYRDETKNCLDNADQALQMINNSLAHAVLVKKNFVNSKKSIIYITCRVNGKLGWWFSNYVGKPVNPGSPSCQVTAPLEVNFGIVTAGDNNKTIDKQVTIKCDEATRVNLTLQGDGNTNLLIMSGTTIKLGVGGDTQTKDYDVKKGRVTMANLTFTLSDTGDTLGVKKGYALLISEIP